MIFRDELDEKKKVGVGSRFICDSTGDFYVLMSLTHTTVVLVNVNTGNRYDNPLEVRDVTWLSREEWNTITGSGQSFRMLDGDTFFRPMRIRS